jgi:ABC-type sugar transport system permease subunit/ABC-type glycerol-3-phosphate transport system substrate-binding protein
MANKLFYGMIAIAAFMLFALIPVARAGYIEVGKDGKTIIHVKVALLPDPTNPDAAVRARYQVVRAFEKDFPAIFAKKYRAKYKADMAKYGNFDWDKVEIQLDKFSGLRVEGVETDLLAIAGGIAPDVLYINFRKSDNYIRSHFLTPLDSYFESMPKKEFDRYSKSKVWPAICRKGPDGKKHIWAIPSDGILGRVVVYRKDLFEDKGVPFPTKEWTWEDLLDKAKKLTDPVKGTYGVGLGAGKHESWYWITFLWSAGGDVMTYDEKTDQWTCVFDSDAGVKALDFYTRLCAERWRDSDGKITRGYAYKEAAERDAKWERGEIGMKFAYIEEQLLSKLNPEAVGIVPVPLGPPGSDGKRIRSAEINCRMLGLYSQVKSQVIRDAAWEYMSYMDSEKAQGIRTRVMVEAGYGSFIHPKYLKKYGYADLLRLAPKGWAETFDIALETGSPEPYGKNSNVAYDLMTYPMQEADQLSRQDELPKDKKARYKILKAILVKHCDRANEIMIGRISKREMFWRRVLAWTVLTVIFGTFFFVFRHIFKTFSPPEDDVALAGKKWDFKKFHWAYVILIPACVTILLWRYVPLGRGSMMAVLDYQLIGKSTFVGVDNFANILVDSDWWNAVYNATRYSFLVMALTFLPPIILAILLQEIPTGKLFFRIIFYLPAVITGLVTALLWKQFYDPVRTGVLNRVILSVPAIGFIALGAMLMIICLMFANRLRIYEMYLAMWFFVVAGLLLLITVGSLAMPVMFPHVETVIKADTSFFAQCWIYFSRLFKFTPEAYQWLKSSDTAMLACVIPMVWAGMGPGCLIYLAALKGIPEDFYEAADIDGATFIDKILFVVFPTLKMLIIIQFVGVFIQSWYRATANVLAMTGGGGNTETAGLRIWFTAFTFLKFGSATAMAWMLGFLLIGFTVHQLRILSRVEFKANTGTK